VTYRHTQIGWAMILILGCVIALLAWTASWSDGQPVVLSVLGLMVVILILFVSQTVMVDGGSVQIRVGPGLLRRRIALSDIESVDQIRLPWWAVTYGIRMSLNGKRQLWRVSGSEAVDLTLSGERRLLITTDEPDILASVIRAAVDAVRGRPSG
jgi:hypothetical protein